MSKKIKEILIHIREELLKEIAENMKIESDSLKSEIGDFYDLADEEKRRQFLLLLCDRDRNKLEEIEQALQRIEEKTYGFCEECGNKILKKRLQVIPFARLCVTCKSELEKREENKKKGNEENFYKGLIYGNAEEAQTD